MINNERAKKLLRDAAEKALMGEVSQYWKDRVTELSRLCSEAGIVTHIAFFGTSILAKATWPEVDLSAIKPSHYTSNKLAYSARSLCHGVLVPLSAELGFDIGASGREPLNNQPYFRMSSLKDGTTVRSGSRKPFEFMISLIDELSEASPSAVIDALASFIFVRRGFQKSYNIDIQNIGIDFDTFPLIIEKFMEEGSEGGRKAQAVTAGVLDAFAQGRVISGRVNDPDRNTPGDVCIVSAADERLVEKAFEVRDKPVTEGDVFIFARKCLTARVREPSIVLAAANQQVLDENSLDEWSKRHGIKITVFYGWQAFVKEALFWASPDSLAAMRLAVGFVAQRLVAVEASPDAVKSWMGLCGAQVQESRPSITL